jgi:uncharacterized protein (TIGR03437 family)
LNHTVKNIQIPIALAAILCLPALCPAQTIPTYTISTIAGNNTAGYSGDTLAATAAEIDGPASLWVDSKGNLYIADQLNNRIRLLTASTGIITTVVGNGTAGFLGDTCGASCGTTVETAVNAEINSPDTVILDSKANIYIADTANGVVRLVTPSGGAISTYAGENSAGPGFSGDGGTATLAQLFGPAGLAMDSSGNLYISDRGNNRIRKVTTAGIISTVVDQSGDVGFAGNGGIALQAHLNGPRGLFIDASGALYIADSGSNMIRKVVAGTITLVAGSTSGLAGVGGDGGQATGALLHGPTSVAVDTCGNVYIADTTNSRIRMVTPNGIINTIAGGNGAAYSGDGGPALGAQLNFPSGVAVDSKGNVYVADTQNAVVRMLTPTSAPPCGGALPSITAGGVIGASAFGGSSSIATGSWIEIYGSNLAADTRQWATSDFNGVNAPITLDRTAVTIAGQSAFIDYISPGQVNAQVPANTGTGPLSLTVSTSAGTSAPSMITVNPLLPGNSVQPGLWAPAQFIVGGKQYVGATHLDGTFVAPPGALPAGYTSSYAKPGETISFYGIGFGTVGPGILPGQIAQQLNTLTLPLQFNFGGIGAAAPQYDGLAPNLVGLYQFNIVVPTSVANGDFVPLTFTLGAGANAVNGNQTLYTAVHN